MKNNLYGRSSCIIQRVFICVGLCGCCGLYAADDSNFSWPEPDAPYHEPQTFIQSSDDSQDDQSDDDSEWTDQPAWVDEPLQEDQIPMNPLQEQPLQEKPLQEDPIPMNPLQERPL